MLFFKSDAKEVEGKLFLSTLDIFLNISSGDLGVEPWRFQKHCILKY